MLGSRVSRKIVLFFASLSLLACAVPAFGASTQVPQPVGPESLGTPIAQTAAAAGTQTAIFSPPTLTQTLTPFPTGTLISAPTLPTFLYALPTLTPLPTFTTTPAVILQIPGGEGDGSAPGGAFIPAVNGLVLLEAELRQWDLLLNRVKVFMWQLHCSITAHGPG